MTKLSDERTPVNFLQDLPPTKMQKNARNITLEVPHDSMKTILKPLRESVLSEVSTSVSEKTLVYLPAIISNCCNISEKNKYV